MCELCILFGIVDFRVCLIRSSMIDRVLESLMSKLSTRVL